MNSLYPTMLRKTIVPATLAVAIVLGLGVSSVVQAQYRYPGSTGSSPDHQANSIHPIRAGGASPSNTPPPCIPGGPKHVQCQPTVDGNGSSDTGSARNGKQNYGYNGRSVSRSANGISPIQASAVERGRYSQPSHKSGNPSMQPGEACPPGSRCAHTQSGGGGSGSGSGGSAYGAQASYGSAAMNSRHQATAIQPIEAGGYGKKSVVSPANNHVANAPSRETGTMGYVNSYTHEQATTSSSLNPGSRGPGTHNGLGKKGPTSITTGQQMVGNTAVGGQTLVTQQPTSFVGANGKRTQLGYQKPTSKEMGSLGKASEGGAPGVNGHSMNLQNGSNASDNLTEWYHSKTGYTGTDNGLTWQKGNKWSGKDSDGLTWNNGRPWTGPDGTGGTYTNGNDVKGYTGSNPQPAEDQAAGEGLHRVVHTQLDISKQPVQSGADMGPTYTKGSAVSATSGKLIKPGKRGSDIGGGVGNTGPQGDGSITSDSGRVSATLTGEAVDVNRKPQEKGQLKANYNGAGGVIDPKKTGGGGG